MHSTRIRTPPGLDWLANQEDSGGVIRSTTLIQNVRDAAAKSLWPERFCFRQNAAPSVTVLLDPNGPWLGPLQFQLLAGINDIVAGHDRIQFTESNRTWRADNVASPLLQLCESQTFLVLQQARDASDRLSRQQRVRYIDRALPEPSESGLKDVGVGFEIATEGCPASPQYLDWALNTAGVLPGRFAVMLRNLVEREASAWWWLHHGESQVANQLLEDFVQLDEDGGVSVDHEGHKKMLAEQGKAANWQGTWDKLQRDVEGAEPSVKAAYLARPRIQSCAWAWRHAGPIYGYLPHDPNNLSDGGDRPGWPFPSRLQKKDMAVASKLQREAAVRRRLGSELWDTGFYRIDDSELAKSTSKQARMEIELACADWQIIRDAGRTLQTIGAAMETMANAMHSGGSAIRRCSVCHRHLGGDGDRTHCVLHRTRAGSPGQPNAGRTEAHWLSGWGEERRKHWLELATLIHKQPKIQAMLVAMEQWWVGAGVGGMDSEQRGTADYRSHAAIQVDEMLTQLELYVGSWTFKRLSGLLREIVMRCENDPGAIRHLKPMGFFALHFAGLHWKRRIESGGDLQLPTDPFHPLAQTVSKRLPFDQSSNESVTWRSVLADLLMQRAWIECGGMEMDLDRLRNTEMPSIAGSLKSPVKRPPGIRARNSIDHEKAAALHAAGYTKAAIAVELGVSRSAVTQFFQRNVFGNLVLNGTNASKTGT